MADFFESSPRPSKRRKTGTYSTDRTVLRSAENPSALSNVSGAWSSISKRLFGSRKIGTPEEVHDDSAYGSKEDSLNEDGIVVPQDEVGEVEEEEDLVEKEVLNNRRPKRKSVPTAKTNEIFEEKENQPILDNSRRKTRLSAAAKQKSPESLSAGSGSKRERFQKGSTQPAGPQPDASSIKNTEKSGKQKRSATGQDQENLEKAGKDVMISDTVFSERDEIPETFEGDVDHGAVTSGNRVSGRERRRPRRFSIDPIPTEKSKEEARKAMAKTQSTKLNNASDMMLSPVPKGILTPSRQKRTGPRKSVVFDETGKDVEDILGFKDISSSKKKGKEETLNTKNMSLQQGKVESDTDNAAKTTSFASSNDAVTTSEIEDENLLFVPDQPADILQDLNLGSINENACLSRMDVEDDPHLTTIKSTILARLTSSTPSPISHLSTQYSLIHTLLSSTITASESNSLLLLGSRGAGKSILLNTALAELVSKHAENFHTVRLNGFFQTDDKLALREIWRQLGREMAVPEEETGEVNSYADTMASLLSLLSHPEELDDTGNAMDVDGEKAAKSVVFILDEFDLFTTHPRQTLLYNLFDIAQSRKAPIAVIGCSTRMDVVECLEKRVKSRFSHRWLHVPSMKSTGDFQEAVQGALCLAEDGSEVLGLTKDELAWRERWNAYIKSTFLPSPAIQQHINQVFHTTKSLPDLLAILYMPTATLTLPATTTEHPANNSIIHTPASAFHPSLLHFLPHLPTLHLTLLVAAARLDAIHALAALNFPLVHNHYADLVRRTRLNGGASSAGLRLWGKEAARAAWEELGVWEVLVPVAGGLGKGDGVVGAGEGAGSGDGVSGSRMWRVDVSLEEVEWAVREKLGGVGVGEVLGRWCREIVV